MDRIDVELLRARLCVRKPRVIDDPAVRARAAVAAIVRPAGDDDAEVLLIRRADREGDPWSGHMAFPGGRMDPGDRDLRATAVRETREEVGLDLERDAELVCQLDDVHAVARARRTGLIITPFVFALRRDAPLAINHEVAEVAWARLGPLVRGEVATTLEYEHEGRVITLPGYRVGERVVWGLTYGMLDALFQAVRG